VRGSQAADLELDPGDLAGTAAFTRQAGLPCCAAPTIILSRFLYQQVGRVMPPPRVMYLRPFVRASGRARRSSRLDTADLARDTPQRAF